MRALLPGRGVRNIDPVHLILKIIGHGRLLFRNAVEVALEEEVTRPESLKAYSGDGLWSIYSLQE